jgi:hypothetical protein
MDHKLVLALGLILLAGSAFYLHQKHEDAMDDYYSE